MNPHHLVLCDLAVHGRPLFRGEIYLAAARDLARRGLINGPRLTFQGAVMFRDLVAGRQRRPQ